MQPYDLSRLKTSLKDMDIGDYIKVSIKDGLISEFNPEDFTDYQQQQNHKQVNDATSTTFPIDKNLQMYMIKVATGKLLGCSKYCMTPYDFRKIQLGQYIDSIGGLQRALSYKEYNSLLSDTLNNTVTKNYMTSLLTMPTCYFYCTRYNNETITLPAIALSNRVDTRNYFITHRLENTHFHARTWYVNPTQGYYELGGYFIRFNKGYNEGYYVYFNPNLIPVLEYQEPKNMFCIWY